MKITIIRPLYWTLRKALLNNLTSRGFWLSQHNLILAEKQCSICSSENTYLLNFEFEGYTIQKFLCKDCGHIFSSNLNMNLDQAKTIFHYQGENKQKSGQEFLIEKLLEITSHENPKISYCILDFGVGGNLGAREKMQTKYKDYLFFACDLYPSNEDFYFQSYVDDSKFGNFDGISSNAVVEHLDNTIEAWKYLNQLLKPTKMGKTYMVHAFPSQINEDFYHWTIRIKSHECLFSKQSLAILCEKTGFKLMKIKYFHQVQHPVFIFKKVSDCE